VLRRSSGDSPITAAAAAAAAREIQMCGGSQHIVLSHEAPSALDFTTSCVLAAAAAAQGPEFAYWWARIDDCMGKWQQLQEVCTAMQQQQQQQLCCSSSNVAAAKQQK
jgi:hypothetical protein